VIRQARGHRLKWIGLAASVVVLVIWIASHWWDTSYCQTDRAFAIVAGAFAVRWGPNSKRDRHYSHYSSWSNKDSCNGWSIEESGFSFWYWRPAWHRWVNEWLVIIPCWIPVLFLVLPTVILFYRDRRPSKGQCQACGYDLTGNESGTCPECGTSVGEAAA
jgi:hypothetical protein